MKMGMPIVKYRENTTARKGLTYSKMTQYMPHYQRRQDW